MEKERRPSELDGVFDTLMEDIPIERAYRVRKAVDDVNRNLWRPALAMILAFGFFMLMFCGLMVVGDYLGINGEPTDWEQMGAICVLFPTCTLMGFVICHETIMDKIRSRLRHVLDDALEEYVKEKSTETGDKPN